MVLCAAGAESCSHKTFSVFDALYYRSKPDLTDDGLSRIKLIYENRLVTDGELDWDKVNAQLKETIKEGFKVVSIDIESWYSTKNGDEINVRLDSLFRHFKTAIPDCEIGNYGIPVQNLNVLRHVAYERGAGEEDIPRLWANSSMAREPAGAVSDILLPSTYIFNYDIDQWEKDLHITVKRIKGLYPDKKIYIYLWPQCYDWKTSPYYMKFIPADLFKRMLEIAYPCTDGVILWASGVETHIKREPIYWEDPRVQEFYSVVKDFIKAHKRNIKTIK